MKRLAFLIGGTYRAAENRLSGVAEIIRAWRRFLTSPYGGSWTDDEIVDLSGEDKNAIVSEIRRGGEADYSLVCFFGHGRLAKDRFGFSAAKVFINDRDALQEDECNPGSPRCSMILDCSRKRPSRDKVSFAKETPGESTRENARARFEEELLKCETGLAMVFAADDGEASADGRSFSRVLIAGAKDPDNYSDGILRIDRAVRLAGNATPERRTPVYEGGRRVLHFPFALLPKDRSFARKSK